MKSFCLFLILFCATHALASQDAIVVTDGAMIYKNSDFDSSVIGYMRAGQKTQISSKTFGAFYRVQFKQGVIGYISDVDIEPHGGRKSGIKTSANQKINKSFISKKYIGIVLGQMHFSEVYNNLSVGDSMIFYGAKLTMPVKFLSGPFVLDSELLYHSGAPSYYNTPTSAAASGKILIVDAEVMFSLFELRKRTIWGYVGAGPAISYTSFVVDSSGTQRDLTEAQFGGVITGGIAMRASKFAIKLEPKYFAFKSGYYGFVGALQYEF